MLISVLSNMATAPLELLKVRAQLLQEGRRLHGFGFEEEFRLSGCLTR